MVDLSRLAVQELAEEPASVANEDEPALVKGMPDAF